MKLLLVHPEDSPDCGAWNKQAWDQVIDLGKAGAGSYERWTRHFRCPVTSMDSFRLGAEDFHHLRNVLAAGSGRLQDRENLDWWELTAILFHDQLETLAILSRFVRDLGAADEVFITRSDFYSDALRLLLGKRLRCLRVGAAQKAGLRHYFRVASKFPLGQLAEIAGDKFDAAYSLRGWFSPRRKPSARTVVLLPSAYENASRTGMAYAETIPEKDFLLVATRRSGWLAAAPANVVVSKLASYASGDRATREEYAELLERWRMQRRDLDSVPEIAMLGRLGFLDSFPKLINQGLAIRDAWRNVFEVEPVQAVLCADDYNPYTHIPLLLAAQRGLPTIACHHGALDGRHLIKRNHADVILAKGKMEEDYLLRVCGLPRDKVEIGAPAPRPLARPRGSTQGGELSSASCIVLFSEPYEVFGGRCGEFYQDLLPALADIALKTGRKLIVKLHPFETERERKSLLAQLLTSTQLAITRVVSGALTPDLLEKTWFGVTVLSTVAVECAMQAIPCFLCGWLEYSRYGYIQQFSRFGVGHLLQNPAEIPAIPHILETYSHRPELTRELAQSIGADRLRELLSGIRRRDRAIAV
jgi:hypothetical protein